MKRLSTFAGLAILLAACENTPSQPAQSIAASTFNKFDAIDGPAQCVAPPATADGFATYEPFLVPAGYRQRIVASQINDFTPVAGAGGDIPDMITLNETGPFAGRFLYQTHEVNSNGAVTVTDLRDGGTRLVTQSPDYNRLDGIAWSPWGTVIFSAKSPAGSCTVRSATGVVTANRGGRAVARGTALYTQGNLYGISSTPGAVYKFVPDAAAISAANCTRSRCSMRHRTGAAVWVPLDRAASVLSSIKRPGRGRERLGTPKTSRSGRAAATSWRQPGPVRGVTSETWCSRSISAVMTRS